MENSSVPVTVLEKEQVPAFLCSDGQVRPEGGKLYAMINGRALCCPDTPEGRDLLHFLANGNDSCVSASGESERLLRSILLRNDTSAADKLNERYGLPLRRCRCALVFEQVSGNGLPLLKCLKELAPTEENDILLEAESGRTVLVRCCEEDENFEEYEYAMALIDTVKEETGMELHCGIGRACPELGGLSESYHEAIAALRLASEFHRKGYVFRYDRMMTERILSRIPPEERKTLYATIFSGKNRHLLDGEMKETVDMFFRSDLNLSDTARQMFIHRNTLTYRLEKIRKETGLDLRTFEDAVAYRILSELYETEEHEANENA